MNWFFKEPPPPPPPKSKIPGWVNIATPIIFAIIVGLTGFVFTGLNDQVKAMEVEFKGEIKDIENKKVDNTTLQLMIEKQDDRIQTQQKNIDRTLEEIKILRQQQYRLPNAPSSMRVEEKPTLSPDEFKQYLKMNTEERAAFRKLHHSYNALPK